MQREGAGEGISLSKFLSSQLGLRVTLKTVIFPSLRTGSAKIPCPRGCYTQNVHISEEIQIFILYIKF